MNHLEELVKQYYEWRGYLVRTNVKVGRLSHGGLDGELDIVAYHPLTNHLIHLEPSIDANSWSRREDRFDHKFKVGRQYIRNDVFPWVDTSTPIQQVAILPTSSRKELAGGEVISIDELMKEIKEAVVKAGVMAKNAIPEEYDLLRTIQMTVCGYHRTV